jgi:hypothetical protein
LAAKAHGTGAFVNLNRPISPYLLRKTSYFVDLASAGGDVGQKLVYSLLA